MEYSVGTQEYLEVLKEHHISLTEYSKFEKFYFIIYESRLFIKRDNSFVFSDLYNLLLNKNIDIEDDCGLYCDYLKQLLALLKENQDNIPKTLDVKLYVLESFKRFLDDHNKRSVKLEFSKNMVNFEYKLLYSYLNRDINNEKTYNLLKKVILSGIDLSKIDSTLLRDYINGLFAADYELREQYSPSLKVIRDTLLQVKKKFINISEDRIRLICSFIIEVIEDEVKYNYD